MISSSALLISLVLVTPIILSPIVDRTNHTDQESQFDKAPQKPEIQVKTGCGSVTGNVSKTSSGSNIYEFYNVPYSSPPTGNRRFEPPLVNNKQNPWSNAVDASKERTIQCVQMTWTPGTDGTGTEDCLYLTIRSTNITASKPVIVWIHGGGLLGGYCCRPGYSFDAELTETLDAVTVNINYRLGFLGFHSIEELWNSTSGTYANNGIRDMVASLQWIQDNIAHFGGDPTRVTILGHSGGATAALALSSSPLAVNLFHRAVVLAPAAEFRFDHVEGSALQKRTTEVLDVTGCRSSDDKKKCLQEVDAKWFTSYINENVNPSGKLKDLAKNMGVGYFDFPKRYGDNAEYLGLIMVDPNVVTQAPKDLSTAKYLKDIDSKIKVIIGNSIHDAVLYPSNWNLNTFSDLDRVTNVIRGLSRSLFNITGAEISDVLQSYNGLSPQRLWDTITSDMRVTCPLNSIAESMSESSHHEIYRMFTKFGLTPDFQVYHGWEVEALFGYKVREIMGVPIPASSTAWKFREVLVGVLKQFADDGIVDDEWEQFPANSLVIDDSEEMKTFVDVRPSNERCVRLQENNLDQYGWQN